MSAVHWSDHRPGPICTVHFERSFNVSVSHHKCRRIQTLTGRRGMRIGIWVVTCVATRAPILARPLRHHPLKMPHARGRDLPKPSRKTRAGFRRRREMQTRFSAEKTASNAERRVAKCRFWERGVLSRFPSVSEALRRKKSKYIPCTECTVQ